MDVLKISGNVAASGTSGSFVCFVDGAKYEVPEQIYVKYANAKGDVRSDIVSRKLHVCTWVFIANKFNKSI